MRSLRVIVSAALLAASSRAAAAPCRTGPPSAPTPEALAANDLAIKLDEEQRYVEALALYQKAYDLSPAWIILFNIGRMAEKTGDPARAMRAFECHVVEGGSDVDPARRAEVEAALARLRTEVGMLRVEVDEEGALVDVDGRPLGTSPVEEPQPANPGSHRVTVRGSKTESKDVEIVKGQTLTVSFTLREARRAVQEEPFRFPNAAVGAAWIVTGLATVSAAVTGAMALVGKSDIEDDTYLGPDRRPAPGSQLAEKVDRTRALATATDALIVIAAVAGAAAVTFSVVNAVAGDAPQRRREALWIGAGPAGVSLGGAW